jgi:hypothetical protein|uniref:Uncharacterized protein n=1 Tax=Siphoviridae sp. ctGa111 TaxID=2825413 RepID=A0A8S5VDV4_9CAUD|nr:MAG TPA: hypothetical protein [Siphoviridae sp. ctGa111]
MRSLKEIDDEIKMIEHQKNLDEENHFFCFFPQHIANLIRLQKEREETVAFIKENILYELIQENNQAHPSDSQR